MPLIRLVGVAAPSEVQSSRKDSLSYGPFQIAARIVFPCHSASCGRPKLMETMTFRWWAAAGPGACAGRETIGERAGPAAGGGACLGGRCLGGICAGVVVFHGLPPLFPHPSHLP